MRGLAGRNIIVTGGGSGIGAATVARLHEEGAATVAWDLTAPAAPEGSFGQAVDVTDGDAITSALAQVRDELGEIHGLVNCAGTLGAAHKLADQPLEQVRRTFEINTHGALQVLQAVLPVMLEQGGGSIVNVASNAALHARTGLAPYSASKAAVLAYTRTAAREYGRRGIRVNAVCPGGTRTPMMGPVDEKVAEDLARSIPLGRFAEPDEIAATIVFLLSDDASYLTGANLLVDGGALT